jgi:hypothetical protein
MNDKTSTRIPTILVPERNTQRVKRDHIVRSRASPTALRKTGCDGAGAFAFVWHSPPEPKDRFVGGSHLQTN